MTLYNLLVSQMSTDMKRAVDNISNNDKFYKLLGSMETCNKLIDMLSDDTLKMEVTMRHEVLKKGE